MAMKGNSIPCFPECIAFDYGRLLFRILVVDNTFDKAFCIVKKQEIPHLFSKFFSFATAGKMGGDPGLNHAAGIDNQSPFTGIVPCCYEVTARLLVHLESERWQASPTTAVLLETSCG